MNKNRARWISLLVVLAVSLFGSSVVVYGEDIFPEAGDPAAISQEGVAYEYPEVPADNGDDDPAVENTDPASDGETADPAEEAATEENADGSEEAIYSGIVQLLSEAENAEPGQLSLTATKGVYWFTPSMGYNEDLTDTFIYDDGLLKGDSLNFNKQLATMSYEMAVASISSMREPGTPEGYANKSRNLRAYLEDNGFTDFAVNQFYTEKMTETSMGVACAHKRITDNGKKYTVLVVAPRSAGYEAEWASNFMMGAEGDHEGFEIAKNHILEFVKQYVSEYGISGDIKVWTSGYSRGAAVVDLVAAALLRDPNGVLGDDVTLTPENLYCYTFGTPRNADANGDYQDERYLYVHNTFALYDIVTMLPPVDMGFERYGTFTPLIPDDENAKEQMLKLLEETNPLLWATYVNGGDPDSFRAKTIDIEALFRGELKVKDDDSSYLPDDQSAFVHQILEGSLMEAIGTRESFREIYQDPMVHFGSYLLTHTDKAGDLMDGIMKSPYGIPAGAAMYMYILIEKFMNNEIPSSDENVEMIYNYLHQASELIEKLDFDSFPGAAELLELLSDISALTRDGIRIILRNPSTLERMSGLTSVLYSLALRDGLKAAGADQGTIGQLTSYKDSRAMSRILAYLLFEDREQKANDTNLITMNANMIKHAATFIANGTGYMLPHLNEVVVSWLKVQDDYYNGIEKENAAQIAGYRRLYVEQPEGVDVTGYVKDSSGNVVAVFRNGELISRTNSWISMTTSDRGNWLRLPVDEQYNIDFEISDNTTITIIVSEYATYDNKEVRIETGDEHINWKDLMLRTKDRATLVVSSIEPEEDGSYIMNSDAPYYMDLLKRFTITYMLDGGILGEQTGIVSMDVDDGTSLILPVPTRDGYTFAYWSGSRYDAGDIYIVTEDHIFKAIWTKNEYDDDTGDDTPWQPGGSDPDPGAWRKTAPVTGDSGQIAGYCVALLVSGSVMAGLFMLRRKRNAEK